MGKKRKTAPRRNRFFLFEAAIVAAACAMMARLWVDDAPLDPPPHVVCKDTEAARCANVAPETECKGDLLRDCPAACGLCEPRCERHNRTAAFSPGTLRDLFDRAASFSEYAPSWLSRDPPILMLDTFLSSAEAEIISGVCGVALQRSLAGDQVSPVRTSQQCWCDQTCQARHPTVRGVVERIHEITRTDSRTAEHLQIVRYEEGQFYKVHHDQNSAMSSPQGPRILTLFMYLNDVEEGGETAFTDLTTEDGETLQIRPRKGRAILWPSVSDHDPSLAEIRTHHEAKPVVRGEKFGANLWIHLYDWQTPAARNCPLCFRNTA